MTLLGLDFDNTLVRYDNLFHQLALEKGLIDGNIKPNKTIIRDYLRNQDKDEEFTLLQGEVYGLRILEAEPAAGMLEALQELHQSGVRMVLVSHKTKTPYKGPAYNLREAAWSWLEKYSFFNKQGLNWEEKQIYFESNKEDKVKRIHSLGCTHYIDDLPEILKSLGPNIRKFLYCPDKIKEKGNYIHLEAWEELKYKFSG